MLTRGDIRETVERLLDWKPVRSVIAVAVRVQETRWRNKLWAALNGLRGFRILLGRKTWLREPGYYSNLVLNRKDEAVRERIRDVGTVAYVPSSPGSGADPERRRALFYGVMAGLRPYYHPWAGFTGREIPFRDIFEAAGVTILRHQDEETNPAALSSWYPVPWISVHPELFDKDMNIEHELFHELFHLTSPHGDGIHRTDENHVNEVLAGRFMRELLCPLPVTAHMSSENNVATFASLQYTSIHLHNILRLSGRDAVAVEFALTNDWRKGNTPIAVVITQCDGQHGHMLDDLVLLSEQQDQDQSTHAIWSSGFRTGLLGFSREGLYYSRDQGGETWRWWWEEVLGKGGLLDQIETRPERIGVIVSGGEIPFVGYAFGARLRRKSPVESATDEDDKFESLPIRSAILFPDEDSKNLNHLKRAQSSGEVPSILPPGDRTKFTQPETFDDWASDIERAFLDGPPRSRLAGKLNPGRRINPFLRP